MALEAAFGELNAQLYTLREALVDLHTTAVEDKPLQDDAVLVDLFGDAATDLLGWLEGALSAVATAQQAATYPADIGQARQALAQCHERFQHVHQRFATDLISYECIAELTRFGRRRGGEWQAWATGVKAALDECRPRLWAIAQALFACWQELAERAGMNSVAVHAINIGQRVIAPPTH